MNSRLLISHCQGVLQLAREFKEEWGGSYQGKQGRIHREGKT